MRKSMFDLDVDSVVIGCAVRVARGSDLRPEGHRLIELTERYLGAAAAGVGRKLLDERIGHRSQQVAAQIADLVVRIRKNIVANAQPGGQFVPHRVVPGNFQEPNIVPRSQLALEGQ